MDIHPIVIHIPIAFLAIYSILEILSFIPALKKSETIFSIKLFLLFVGLLGAFTSLSTGENASEINRKLINERLVENHSMVAELTSYVYLFILLIYFTISIFKFEKVKNYLNTKLEKSTISLKIINLIYKIGEWFDKNYFLLLIISLVGLVLVFTTGVLGGALVYGSLSNDPFINIALKYLSY